MSKHPKHPRVASDPKVRRVIVSLCELCIAGAGGECHVPGCVLCRNRAPDLPLMPELIEDAPTLAAESDLAEMRARVEGIDVDEVAAAIWEVVSGGAKFHRIEEVCRYKWRDPARAVLALLRSRLSAPASGGGSNQTQEGKS